MKKTCLAALMVIMSTSSVAAADGDKEKPKKEKKICRSEKVTGSLTRVNRICMTQAEWDELAARTKKGLDEMASSAAGGQAISNNPGPGG